MKTLIKKPLSIVLVIALIISAVSIALATKTEEFYTKTKFYYDVDGNGTYSASATVPKDSEVGSLTVKKGAKIRADIYIKAEYYIGNVALYLAYDSDILEVDESKHGGYDTGLVSCDCYLPDGTLDTSKAAAQIKTGEGGQKTQLLENEFPAKNFEGIKTLYYLQSKGYVLNKDTEYKLCSIYFTVKNDTPSTATGKFVVLAGTEMCNNPTFPTEVNKVNEEDYSAGLAWPKDLTPSMYSSADEYEWEVVSVSDTLELEKYKVNYVTESKVGEKTVEGTLTESASLVKNSKGNYSGIGEAGTAALNLVPTLSSSYSDYKFLGWTVNGTDLVKKDTSVTTYDALKDITYKTSDITTLTAVYGYADTSYKVEYYEMDTEGAYPKTPSATSATQNANINDSITLATAQGLITSGTGLTLDSEKSTTMPFTLTASKADNVIKLYYSRPKYSVKYVATVDDVAKKTFDDKTVNNVYYGANMPSTPNDLDITKVTGYEKGYRFDYDNATIIADTTNVAITDGKMPNDNVTVKIPVVPVDVIITFSANEGGKNTLTSAKSVTIKYGETLSADKIPAYSSATDWGIAGWILNDGEKVKFVTAIPISTDSNWDYTNDTEGGKPVLRAKVAPVDGVAIKWNGPTGIVRTDYIDPNKNELFDNLNNPKVYPTIDKDQTLGEWEWDFSELTGKTISATTTINGEYKTTYKVTYVHDNGDKTELSGKNGTTITGKPNPDVIAGYDTKWSDWESPITVFPANNTTVITLVKTPKDITVKFDTNGGSKAPDDQDKKYDQKATKPADPTYSNYTFDGWYLKNASGEYTTKWDFTKSVDDNIDFYAESITLYARYKVTDEYFEAVSYDFNTEKFGYGTTAAKTYTKYVDETATTYATDLPTDPTLEGFTFTEWNFDSATFTPDGNFGTLSRKIYAQYEINKYDVTFIVPNDPTQTTVRKDVVFGSAIEAPADPTHPTDPELKFAGWYDEDGKNLGEYQTMPDKALTFTATFVSPEHTATFISKDWKGNDYTYATTINKTNQPVVYPEDPTRFGYKFMGWDPEVEIMPDEELTFNAKWEIDETFVTVVVGGAVVSGAVIAGVAATNAALITGAAIVGGAVVIGGAVAIAKHTYTVTYMVDGEVYKTYKVLEGTKVITPADPTKDGYEFKGWSPEIPDKMPGNDVTFEAKWVAGADDVIPATGSASVGLAAFAAISSAAAAAYVLSKKKKDEED